MANSLALCLQNDIHTTIFLFPESLVIMESFFQADAVCDHTEEQKLSLLKDTPGIVHDARRILDLRQEL